MKLILASGSPRRSEILKNAGYEFVVKPTSADESLPGGILPEDAVKLLSERKADAAKIECSDVVFSADTVVALGNRILGKPSDKAGKNAQRVYGRNDKECREKTCVRGKNRRFVLSPYR